MELEERIFDEVWARGWGGGGFVSLGKFIELITQMPLLFFEFFLILRLRKALHRRKKVR